MQKNKNFISWITWVTVRTGISLLGSHSFGFGSRRCFSYYCFACKSNSKINRLHPQQTFVSRSTPFQMWKSSFLSAPAIQPAHGRPSKDLASCSNGPALLHITTSWWLFKPTCAKQSNLHTVRIHRLYTVFGIPSNPSKNSFKSFQRSKQHHTPKSNSFFQETKTLPKHWPHHVVLPL